MLPSAHRLRRSQDFGAVVRSGVRTRAGRLTVHHLHDLGHPQSTPVVGFVVSRAVGNSVSRHAVTRKLRAQMAQRLDRLPAASGTVVRAQPGAADLSSADLGRALDRALAGLTRATAGTQ